MQFCKKEVLYKTERTSHNPQMWFSDLVRLVCLVIVGVTLTNLSTVARIFYVVRPAVLEFLDTISTVFTVVFVLTFLGDICKARQP